MNDRRGKEPNAPRRHGRCGLCGAHGRDLVILAQADFIGWACGECVRQLRECQVRRYCGTVEETETEE